jgi:hypothetical protein
MFISDQNPDDAGDIDREIRINRLKGELEELSGGKMIAGDFGDTSPALEETFLARAVEFEKALCDTAFNRLKREGIKLIPPEELDDATLPTRLWEVLQAMAKLNLFVESTNHLSDRELYYWLWSEALREQTPDMRQLQGNWHVSPIGACTDEDIAIFLKYYATEAERRRWEKDFPNDEIPTHCVLPNDRDRNLPRPE